MSIHPLPRVGTKGRLILQAMLVAPGTALQLCERAHIEISPGALRVTFQRLLDTHARLDGLIYSLRPSSRAMLQPEAKPEPYVGQVAGPHFRGSVMPMPVTIYRRAPAEEPA